VPNVLVFKVLQSFRYNGVGISGIIFLMEV
jgi:hypothetical protein